MTRLQFLLTAALASLGAMLPIGQCRARFASGYRPVHPAAGYSVATFSLMTKDGKWQWRTRDGIEMSPVFATKEAAMQHRSWGYPERCQSTTFESSA